MLMTHKKPSLIWGDMLSLQGGYDLVHQFKNNGYNIVLDVESGSIHQVDEMAYDAIDCLNREICLMKIPKDESSEPPYLNIEGRGNLSGKKEETLKILEENLRDKYSKNQLIEVAKEIDQLVQAGQLFSPDIRDFFNFSDGDDGFRVLGDSQDFLDSIKKGVENHKPVVKALCLHIAHDCNLACKYCFAHEGEYHGSRELMSTKVGKKALDFLIANSGNRRNLEVDFFGGEPLMNWQVVKDIVAYGRELEKLYSKNFRFTLTTNGVLLEEEVMDFANKEMENVVLSLDGRREINDKMRPTRNGRGSYDVVVPKFQEFVRKRGDKEYFIRGTFTRKNLDFVEDIKHVAKLGFNKISMEPVVAQEDHEDALGEEDLSQVFNQYDQLAKEMAKIKGTEDEFTFFHFLLDLEGGPCVAKRVSGCGAGTEYMAVTPTGDLYPCHQFVGQEKFLLGDVEHGIVKPEIPARFNQCNVYSKKECKKCFAKYYCSGGCMANSYDFHKDINKVYEIGCEMERKRVECAIMLKVAELIKV